MVVRCDRDGGGGDGSMKVMVVMMVMMVVMMVVMMMVMVVVVMVVMMVVVMMVVMMMVMVVVMVVMMVVMMMVMVVMVTVMVMVCVCFLLQKSMPERDAPPHFDEEEEGERVVSGKLVLHPCASCYFQWRCLSEYLSNTKTNANW